MKITYYLDLISHWCYRVEPTWAELKKRYSGRVQFEWKSACIDPKLLGVTAAQEEWWYRRGDAVTGRPLTLHTGWVNPDRSPDYTAPHYVAEASREFGYQDDTVRLALMRAALVDGRRISRMEEAVAIAAAASGLTAEKIRVRAESAEVKARVEASTAEFFAHRITERPAFILEDEIGDKAVFSGLLQIEPLAATIEAMLADTTAYARFAATNGEPPKH